MVIMIMGLPASGKSTFARALAKQLQAVYLSSDQIRNCLDMRGMYDMESRSMIYRIMAKALDRHLSLQRTVVLDASFSRQQWRDICLEKAVAHQKPVQIIELVADDIVIKERLRQKRADSEADLAVYHQMKARFEALDSPHLRLDSGRLPLPVMLMQARQHLTSVPL